MPPLPHLPPPDPRGPNDRDDDHTDGGGFEGGEEGGATLSDADVQIIYEILREAQTAPTFAAQPFHALFPAYRDVLARYDLTSGADRTYLRFLYRLEQRRAPSQTLFEAFEQRLAQLGIEIKFSSDGSDGDTRNPQEAQDETNASVPLPQHRARTAAAREEDLRDMRPRSRRASFSSFVDFEEQARDRVRAESRGSVSRLQDYSHGFGAHMPVHRPESEQMEARSSEQHDKDEDSSTDYQPWQRMRRSSRTSALPDPIPSNILSAPLRRVQPELPAQARQQDARQQPVDTTQSGSSEASTSEDERSPPLPQQPLELPSQTQLVRDADTFDYFRMRDLTRQILRKWRTKALQKEWENDILAARAAQFDHEISCRHYFERWRNAYRLQGHLRQAEQVLALWETRLRKARDAVLLTKAFTHWAASTHEERERSSAARRHILRFKFFNTWREITAAKKLKTQREILAKFFAIWKQKFLTTWIHENKAAAVYQEHLVENTYWNWFWKFCEERAPQWREALLKRRYLQRLSEALVSKKELADRVDVYRGQELRYRFFGKWKFQHQQFIEHEKEAIRFQQTHTVARALPQWQHQLKLVAPARQVAAMVQTRMRAGVLRTWVTRTKMQQQARRLDAMRVTRNAWTAWNDRLRVDVMQQQIHDRLAVEALYKWVLAERMVLLKRVNDERLLQRTFSWIVAKRDEKKRLLQDAYDKSVTNRVQFLKKAALAQWAQQLRRRREQTEQALEHFAPRALGAVMETWHAKQDVNEEHDRWAVEFLYYIRASRTVKAWRRTAAESRKRKMQAAYAQVRVQQKKKTASAVLQIYTERMQQIQDQHVSAAAFRAHSTRTLLHQVLRTWHSRLAQTHADAAAATTHRADTLAAQALGVWAPRSLRATQQQRQAGSFAALHVEKVAYESLRTLQLRVLELQNLQTKALTIRSWNRKRFARRVVRGWREAALRRRGSDTVASSTARGVLVTGPSDASSPTRGTPATWRAAPSDASSTGLALPLDAELPWEPALPPTADDRPWAFPAHRGLFEPTASLAIPPLPGYLSTPSKRAARARVVATDPSALTTEHRTTTSSTLRDAIDQRAAPSLIPQAAGSPRRSTLTLPAPAAAASPPTSFTPATDPRAMRRARALQFPPGALDGAESSPLARRSADAMAERRGPGAMLDAAEGEPLGRSLFRGSGQRSGFALGPGPEPQYESGAGNASAGMDTLGGTTTTTTTTKTPPRARLGASLIPRSRLFAERKREVERES